MFKLILFILLLGVLYMTNPPKAKHQENVVEKLNEMLGEKVDESGLGILKGLSKRLGGSLLSVYVQDYLAYENYYVASISRLPYLEGEEIKALGIAGQVFLLGGVDKEALQKKLGADLGL
ncbi:MAG: DUF4359 domain-containing protein [Bacteroidetes bacterium]|jgi:hypothetical protein|nr:DUF4359 domain-containing protein [Bacteroidota bacterium]